MDDINDCDDYLIVSLQAGFLRCICFLSGSFGIKRSMMKSAQVLKMDLIRFWLRRNRDYEV